MISYIVPEYVHLHNANRDILNSQLRQLYKMNPLLPPRTPSVSSSEDSDDDQNYDDWVSASGDPQAKSLFEERELANIAEALKYDRDTYGFDLEAFSKQLGMPDHGAVSGLVLIRNKHSMSIKEYGW
jgi:hypothetical protein